MSFRLLAPVVLALSSVALSGCATSYGQKIEADNVSKIVKGTTTSAQVIEWFGEPTQNVIMPDGGRTMHFIYYRASLGNSIYGQIPGFITGKGKAKTGTNLTVVTDKNGIVRDFEYSPGSGK